MNKIGTILALCAIVLAQVLLGFFGGTWVINGQYQNGYHAGVASQQLEYANKAAVEKERQDKEREAIERDAQAKIDKINADVKRAGAVNDRLLVQLENIKNTAQRAGAVVTPGTSAEKAVNLLSDMLRESVGRSSVYAEYADRAHEAGLACEQQYQSARGNHGTEQHQASRDVKSNN